jgi:hypothetical protein
MSTKNSHDRHLIEAVIATRGPLVGKTVLNLALGLSSRRKSRHLDSVQAMLQSPGKLRCLVSASYRHYAFALETNKYTMVHLAKRRQTQFQSNSAFALAKCCERGRRLPVSLACTTLGLVGSRNRKYRIDLEGATCTC